jgi:hypothetical protein
MPNIKALPTAGVYLKCTALYSQLHISLPLQSAPPPFSPPSTMIKHLLGETQVFDVPKVLLRSENLALLSWQDLSTGLIMSSKNNIWYGGGNSQVVQLLIENKAEVNMADEVRELAHYPKSHAVVLGKECGE